MTTRPIALLGQNGSRCEITTKKRSPDLVDVRVVQYNGANEVIDIKEHTIGHADLRSFLVDHVNVFYG